MKGISRRARTCAVVAATGVAVLGSSAVASAQRAPSMGDGLPVGQTGMQMFNFSRYISGTAAEQKAKVEEVFAMLQSKGIRVVEPYSLHSMSAADFRALADKYNLHVVGRHGGVAENTFDSEIATAKTLGQQFIGSGGTAAPGQGTYAQTLATAATLNRLGKRSVTAGAGKVYIHNHTGEFDAKYDVNGTIKTAWEILMDNTDSRYVAAEIDAGWASDAPVDVADLINRYPTRVEMMHVKDLTNVAPIGRSGNPVVLGTGEINYGPIFAAAKNKYVKWYHYELDPPSATFDAFAAARSSFDAVRGAAAPALYASSPSFGTEPAAPTGSAAPVPVKVENLGDAPLNITNVTIGNTAGEPTGAAGSAGDFTITSNTCTTGPVSFGTFTPGTARDYSATLVSEATTTTPDATLSVADPSAVAAGHLVNGTVALQQALKARASNATTPAPAYASLPETGAALPLLTYNGPVTRDRVTIGFQQSIGAAETLLRGTYGKTLTFTLASTTP
jgi:sugar phosphate isomerase/epimerase